MSEPSLTERIQAALALHQSGRPREAQQAYERIIALHPEHPDAYHLMGLMLHQYGHTDKGLELCRHSIQLAPQNPQFRTNIIGVFRSMGHLDEAIIHQKELAALVPENADHAALLGAMLFDDNRLNEAEGVLRKVLEHHPNLGVALLSMGHVHLARGRVADALELYARACELRPDQGITHYNLGNALVLDLQLEKAKIEYSEAIRLDPSLAEAHANLGKVMMLEGDFENGWPEYERRWQGRGFPNRQADGPLWTGGAMNGETLLLTSEQGYGDAFQFGHFITTAAAQSGARVVVEAQAEILDLMASIPGVDEAVARGTPLPPFSAQAPFMSLPNILKISLDTIPADTSYITPPSNALAKWEKEMTQLPGRKVGIVWRGNPDQLRNVYRSCPTEALAPLLDIDGVSLVGLQKDPTDTELQALPGMIDFGRRIQSFNDTAAIMRHLDLVISVCTSTAHLAGALGCPTWVMLSTASDWRWFLDREDCPWYPTARLFRQTSLHDWSGVTQRIASALLETH